MAAAGSWTLARELGARRSLARCRARWPLFLRLRAREGRPAIQGPEEGCNTALQHAANQAAGCLLCQQLSPRQEPGGASAASQHALGEACLAQSGSTGKDQLCAAEAPRVAARGGCGWPLPPLTHRTSVEEWVSPCWRPRHQHWRLACWLPGLGSPRKSLSPLRVCRSVPPCSLSSVLPETQRAQT